MQPTAPSPATRRKCCIFCFLEDASSICSGYYAMQENIARSSEQDRRADVGNLTVIGGCKIECVPASDMTPQDGTNTKDRAAKCCEWDTTYMMATKKKGGANLWWMQGARTSSINKNQRSLGNRKTKKEDRCNVPTMQVRVPIKQEQTLLLLYQQRL